MVRALIDVSAVPDRPAGAGTYTVALVRALDDALAADPQAGVDLVLLARTGDRSRWESLAPRAEVHDVVPRRRPARLAWEQTAGPRFAARVGADVWHGPHYTLPLRLGIPTVVTVHDLTFFDQPQWHERSKVAFFRSMIGAAVARATVCVCVSNHTSRRLAAVTGRAESVVVIRHGVDHTRFHTTSPAASARDAGLLATLGIGSPYVAFVGTLEPRKDVPSLVAAFARVHERHPDLRLVLAGGAGWGARAVQAAVREQQVATSVVRPGYIPDAAVAPLLRHAAVVAYPSLEEGFGLPALEALACGAPLVSTTGSAVEEVVGDAALLVAPGDVTALAGALEEALDPWVAQRLRLAGPPRAAEFTWLRCARAHLDAYRHAATGTAGVGSDLGTTR